MLDVPGHRVWQQTLLDLSLDMGDVFIGPRQPLQLLAEDEAVVLINATVERERERGLFRTESAPS